MTIKGSCHCGKTSFEIYGDVPEQLTHCTCSFCSKRGALYAYYQPDQFRVNASAEPMGSIAGTQSWWLTTFAKTAVSQPSRTVPHSSATEAGTRKLAALASMPGSLMTSMQPARRFP